MPDPKHVDVPEEAGEAAADFLSAWKFCPMSQATEPSRSCLDDAAKQFVEAVTPAIRKQGAEEERARLAHGGEPDISPGDLIAARPDGTITLDDGITTWNPERAARFLIDQVEAELAERLLSDEAIRRGEQVLDDDRAGEALGEGRTDYALVKRIILALLDQKGPTDA